MTISFLLGLCLLLPGTLPGSPVEQGFVERFDAIEDGESPAGWEVISGEWEVRAGELCGRPDPKTGEAFLLVKGAFGGDLSVEADFAFEQVSDPSRWVALVVRAAGPERPGLQFTMRRDVMRGNGLEIASLRMPEGRWKVFKTGQGAAPIALGERHRLRAEIRGRRIRAWLDGTPVLSSARAGEVEGGARVGIRLHGARVVVDNVRIQRLESLPRSTAPERTLPLVIAHRGFSSVAPENTRAAYLAAIDVGAAMAECDVWLTADRVPVLMHDESLARTTGHAGRVGDLTLAQVEQLDAGSWKGSDFAGEPVPTLRGVLEAVRGKLRLVIEIKQAGMEQEVLAAIAAAGLEPGDVMIFAFDRGVVARMVDLASRTETGPPPVTWLIGDMPHRTEARRELLRLALQAHASAIGLPLQRVDPALVRAARARGLSVYVWTVNAPDDMRFLIEIGVDGIITDRPDRLAKILDED